jgi:hypothetical protein
MWVAVVCVVLTLSATANAGRDFVNARALLQTADIESVANAVAQQPSVPQMVRIGHARQLRAVSNLLQTISPGRSNLVQPYNICAVHLVSPRFQLYLKH